MQLLCLDQKTLQTGFPTTNDTYQDDRRESECGSLGTHIDDKHGEALQNVYRTRVSQFFVRYIPVDNITMYPCTLTFQSLEVPFLDE